MASEERKDNKKPFKGVKNKRNNSFLIGKGRVACRHAR